MARMSKLDVMDNPALKVFRTLDIELRCKLIARFDASPDGAEGTHLKLLCIAAAAVHLTDRFKREDVSLPAAIDAFSEVMHALGRLERPEDYQ